LAGGKVRVLSRPSTSSPDGCFYIGTFSATKRSAVPRDDSLRTTFVLLPDAGSGRGWVDLRIPKGRYYMEIETDCTWRVVVRPR
jgi:hypothetical protein